MRELSLQQTDFVKYYCHKAYGNATKAAIMAGYSVETARNQGCRLLTKDYIKADIKAELDKIAEKGEYNQVKSEQLLYDLLERCKDSKDRAVEIATIRELNTINALRTENIHTTTDQQRELDEREAAAARKVANILNLQELRESG